MINKVQNSTNFGAIKLSSDSRPFAKKMAEYLDNVGFKDLGAGDIYQKCPKIDDKAQIAKTVRDGDLLYYPEFATVFFHNEKEAYIVGCTPQLEQDMLPSVQYKDPGARLNLGI